MENSEAIKSTAPGRSSPYADPKQSKQNFVSIAAPTYAAAFRCIGASCEDTCCGDWDIPVDRETYGKYQGFPAEKLGALVSRFVLIHAPNSPDGIYAQISRAPSGFCPFLGTDHLCDIQKEYGPKLLSATCSIYPRSLSRVAGELEGSLSLSCPEAVRNVLLVPDFMQIKGDLFSGTFRTDNIFRLAGDQSGFAYKEESLFASIRTLLIDMVRDRSRPMWNRLLLIGSLCKRMDDVRSKEEIIVPTILGDYRRIIENQIFPAELDSMPSLPRVKMEMIFELIDARIRDGAGPRFQDTFWTFVQGICAPPSSPPGDDIHRFLQAEELHHRPFFAKFPFILENYLVNYMFQNLFPYGREGSPNFTPRSMFDEFILMTTQFSLINALLIGIAGHHKEAFAQEHVVTTIQSFTRAIEHYPDVLNSINESMRRRGLDSLQGMAIMLKH